VRSVAFREALDVDHAHSIGAGPAIRHPTQGEPGPTKVDAGLDRGRWCAPGRGRTVRCVSTAHLEHPSLLPSVLLGDTQEGGRPGRSTRDWIVDVTAVAIAVVCGLALFAVTTDQYDPPDGVVMLDLVFGLAGCLALWFRRRWPVGVALAILPLTAFSSMSAAASAIALFTVAVHRPVRPVAVLAALYLLTVPVYFVVRGSDSLAVDLTVGVLVTVVVVAWGMFVRARRQLVLSLRERARRAESEQALRVEQARRMERDRIAREMHDVLAHRISLVSLHAGALEFAPSSSPEEVARAAGVIRSAAHQALEDLREVIGVLREGGEDGGAPERPQPTLADLDVLLEESRAAGMRVRGAAPAVDPATVPASVGRNAYRVVQEGLTNARKHAPECAVDVLVGGGPGEGLTVELRNPLPVGRAVSGIPGAGTGLVGLTERVELAGGRLEHGVHDGQWRLRAWLPWPAG
jgi:signal transduction histidine kinase